MHEVLEPIGTTLIVAGPGFHFGHRREGDLALLERLGIATRAVEPLPGISSTEIRHLVQHGDVAAAAPLLGRPVEVERCLDRTEGAPRQGRGGAGWIGQRLSVGAVQQRRLLACGAGAGLAAVYNVPLGGAAFTLEVLLGSIALADVVPAVATAALAAVVAWPILGHRPTYPIPVVRFDAPGAWACTAAGAGGRRRWRAVQSADDGRPHQGTAGLARGGGHDGRVHRARRAGDRLSATARQRQGDDRPRVRGRTRPRLAWPPC